MQKKWLYIAGFALILLSVILAWQFAAEIQAKLGGIFLQLILLFIAFSVGWAMGRFGGKKPQKPEDAAR